MPEFCTCGAEPPSDARFCHKCGRPLRDEPPVAEELPIEPPRAAAAVAPAPIDFHNGLAVRVGFLTALLATLLNQLLVYACPLWLVAAGFFCVYLYHRRTGQPLSVGNGARIGWITGLFSYVLFAVLFTIGFVSAVRSGELFQQIGEVPFFPGSAEQVRALFRNPAYLAINLVLGLVVMFVVFTMFTIVGGALGAKVLGRERT